MAAIIILLRLSRAQLRNGFGEFDVFAARNLAGHFARRVKQSRAVVPGAQRRPHRPQGAAGESIRDIGFHAAARLDIALPVLDGEQEQNALIAFLVSDAPEARYIEREVAYRRVTDCINGDKRELYAELLLYFRAKRLERLFVLRIYYVAQVADIAGGLGQRMDIGAKQQHAREQ